MGLSFSAEKMFSNVLVEYDATVHGAARHSHEVHHDVDCDLRPPSTSPNANHAQNALALIFSSHGITDLCPPDELCKFYRDTLQSLLGKGVTSHPAITSLFLCTHPFRLTLIAMPHPDRVLSFVGGTFFIRRIKRPPCVNRSPFSVRTEHAHSLA